MHRPSWLKKEKEREKKSERERKNPWPFLDLCGIYLFSYLFIFLEGLKSCCLNQHKVWSFFVSHEWELGLLFPLILKPNLG